MPVRGLSQVLCWLSHQLQSAANGSQRRVRQLFKVGLVRMPDGAAIWPTCMGWLLPGRDAQNHSFSSSPYPSGLSFGNKGILIWTFNALFRCWCWKLLCVDPCMWASTWMHQTKQDCFCTCLQSNLVLKFLILSKRNTWEIGAVVMDKGQTFK